jgi:hypothetical protein
VAITIEQWKEVVGWLKYEISLGHTVEFKPHKTNLSTHQTFDDKLIVNDYLYNEYGQKRLKQQTLSHHNFRSLDSAIWSFYITMPTLSKHRYDHYQIYKGRKHE